MRIDKNPPEIGDKLIHNDIGLIVTVHSIEQRQDRVLRYNYWYIEKDSGGVGYIKDSQLKHWRYYYILKKEDVSSLIY